MPSRIKTERPPSVRRAMDEVPGVRRLLYRAELERNSERVPEVQPYMHRARERLTRFLDRCADEEIGAGIAPRIRQVSR